MTRWGDLATPDALPIFQGLLDTLAHDEAGQRLAIAVLLALREDAVTGFPAELLMDVARDEERWSETRELSVGAFVRQHPNGGSAMRQLRTLLDDIADGKVSDPFNGLTGMLLSHLYPKHLPAHELWRHLRQPHPTYIGSYGLLAAPAMLGREATRQDAAQARLRQTRRRWQAFVRENATVRQNWSPNVLQYLAQLHRGTFVEVEGDTPRERLRWLLDDDDLVEVALGAIRSTLGRDDLPSVAEVAALKPNQPHPLADPFLLALELLPSSQAQSSQDRLRLALAFQFAAPGQEPRWWYATALKRRAHLVASTLVQYCRVAFRAGNASRRTLSPLADDASHAEIRNSPLWIFCGAFRHGARSKTCGRCGCCCRPPCGMRLEPRWPISSSTNCRCAASRRRSASTGCAAA